MLHQLLSQQGHCRDHREEKNVKAGTTGEQLEEGLGSHGEREGESWLLFLLPVNLTSLGSISKVCL